MAPSASSPAYDPVHVVGAGLAGSEAAWQIAEAGLEVVLHEMRPERMTPAHQGGGFAELVCSNSLRADDWAGNAVGLLHQEMRRGSSLILAAADRHQVPAGGALAVDREGFSAEVTARLHAHPRVRVEPGEVAGLPPPDWTSVVVATGPLTSEALGRAVLALTGEEELAFFDAIAPIVYLDSIDMDVAWRQSRYDKEGPGGDAAAYINCPLDVDAYARFVQALLDGPRAEWKDWERDTPYFDGCLPVEVMAERGAETLRFGPMKPVGLTNPHRPERPHAVVQLRQDNALGTLYNMVGFQTKLKHSAQTEVFRTIPGLEGARFARLGGLHRNTFLNSPKLLDGRLRLRAEPRLRFAGQITGVEGYVESAAIGLLAGRFAAAERLGRSLAPPPAETALGALLAHVTGGHMQGGGRRSFQPMNINYGLLPPMAEGPKRDGDGRRIPPVERGRAKKRAVGERALAALDGWLVPAQESEPA